MNSAALATILATRIDKLRRGVGIAAGIVDANGRRVVCHGRMALGDPRPITAATIFEIGSITKVFTSALLAGMVQRREMALDDPVADHLPPGITLQHLASHTSGLPRLPSNLAPADIHNPYADYTSQHLLEFLATCEQPRDIGSAYEYSNLGYALLGRALADRAGKDYETLLRTRITGPLRMTSTGITLTPAMRSRMASGYGPTRQPMPLWDMPVFAAAGALRSTAGDLLRFLESQFHRPALGWVAARRRDCEFFWHNGETGGFRSFIGYDPDNRRGVVVLSNMSTPEGVDDIGMHVLDPTMPLLRR